MGDGVGFRGVLSVLGERCGALWCSVLCARAACSAQHGMWHAGVVNRCAWAGSWAVGSDMASESSCWAHGWIISSGILWAVHTGHTAQAGCCAQAERAEGSYSWPRGALYFFFLGYMVYGIARTEETAVAPLLHFPCHTKKKTEQNRHRKAVATASTSTAHMHMLQHRQLVAHVMRHPFQPGKREAERQRQHSELIRPTPEAPFDCRDNETETASACEEERKRKHPLL